ncbi:hypothetical protein IAT38_002920 [Cryptococcus sp. DSM 104549]
MSDDDDEPLDFITRTAHPPTETRLINTHPTIIYRPVPDSPGGLLSWLVPWTSDTAKPASELYFEAFRLEDGSILTRRDLLKAYACALNGATFYSMIIRSIKQWDRYYLRVKYAPEIVRLMELRQKMLTNYHELHYAIIEFDLWERVAHLPSEWKPPGEFDLRNLDTAPNQLHATPKILKSITSIFIHSARHVLAVHQAGYSDEWWSIWDEQRPDPEQVRWAAIFPPGFPITEGEITPQRKMIELTTTGEAGSISRRSSSSGSQKSSSSSASASDYGS